MKRIDIVNGLIVTRELYTSDLKTAVFIDIDGSSRYTHISSLRGSLLIDVVFHGSHVEYYIRLSRPEETIYLCEILYSSRPFLITYRYVIEKGEITRSEVSGEAPVVSSGSRYVDRLVEEISSYRTYWSRVFCNTPPEIVEYYESFLKARIGLQYNLFNRVKEAWLEMSSEYLAFTLSLIHRLLLDNGYRPVDLSQVGDRCMLIKQIESIDWRSVSVVYTRDSDIVNISLERWLMGVKPDIAITTSKGEIIIVECKQGPPKTWVKKAIKQAKRYREITPRSILITPRILDENQVSELSRVYDVLIDNCNLDNTSVCISSLTKALSEVYR